MKMIIGWMIANPEITLAVIMGIWGVVESSGYGFLKPNQRRKAKRFVEGLFKRNE